MIYNKTNKEIWDRELAKVAPVSDDTMAQDAETGEYTPAVPLGYDQESKEWSAIREIIENAIKTKQYKTYRLGDDFVETYDVSHESIVTFDVLYLFTKSWETPINFAMVEKIEGDDMVLVFIKGGDSDNIVRHNVRREALAKL